MSARYLVGDVFERLAQLEDGSVDLVLTSPPFLALRSYLPADHPDKGKEIGSEPTPAAFLDTLLALTAEWRRVLAPHGSIAVELGDTYSGSGGAGGDYGPVGLRAGQEPFGGSAARTRSNRPGQYGTDTGPPRRKITDAWPLDKSLCGIPHLYHLSLAYGRNVLRHQPSAAELLGFFDLVLADMEQACAVSDQEPPDARSLFVMMQEWLTKRIEVGPVVEIDPWRVRNVVAWCRPNPPVGALGDKFRPATSYMTIATPYGKRYFDLDAVRTPSEQAGEPVGRGWTGGRLRQEDGTVSDVNPSHGWGDRPTGITNPAGAPPLDYWEIPTQPYSGSHYATWPMALCKRPIEAMVPHKVCRECGKPSERIVGHERTFDKIGPSAGRSEARTPNAGPMGAEYEVTRTTLGWSECDCPGDDKWRRGIVLDPFAGSGTTLAVATGLGRDAIGIDLDARNADLALERVGMFLSVEYPEREGAA